MGSLSRATLPGVDTRHAVANHQVGATALCRCRLQTSSLPSEAPHLSTAQPRLGASEHHLWVGRPQCLKPKAVPVAQVNTLAASSPAHLGALK